MDKAKIKTGIGQEREREKEGGMERPGNKDVKGKRGRERE